MSLSRKLLDGFRYFLEMRAVGGFDEYHVALMQQLRERGEKRCAVGVMCAGRPRAFGNVLCQLPLRDHKINAVRRSTADAMAKAAAGSTGTNANVVNNAAEGIPTVLWSMPIKSMHSAAEILAMEDAKALSQGVREFVRSRRIAEVFGR